MIFLGKKIISYLKSKADLVALLSDSNSIFVENAPVSKNKYVTVSSTVGEDGNTQPSNILTLSVSAVVNRKETSAHSKCIAIADKIDFYINKQEVALTDETYKVLLLFRTGSSELLFDTENQEYYFILSYEVILQV